MRLSIFLTAIGLLVFTFLLVIWLSNVFILNLKKIIPDTLRLDASYHLSVLN